MCLIATSYSQTHTKLNSMFYSYNVTQRYNGDDTYTEFRIVLKNMPKPFLEQLHQQIKEVWENDIEYQNQIPKHIPIEENE